MQEIILGISAFYHDSAAALIINGEIIAAAQEERFTRVKHDESFPMHAIQYVLKEGIVSLEDVTAIVFYDKPLLKFERLLETYHAFVPKGLISFLKAIPLWIREKIFLKKLIKDNLSEIGPVKVPILFCEHHLSHAASAFFPSPFQEAAILTIDGVGEWATCSIGYGKDNAITNLKELHFPHSLGLLYSAFTYYCGFKVNSGEYKLMGLAPYAKTDSPKVQAFKQKILSQLVDVREDGSILLNMKYFRFATGLKMTNDKRWEALLGIPPRMPESEITHPYMELAQAIQQVTEEIVVRLAQTAKNLTQSDYLVMAGGVALNCVANSHLHKSGIFKAIWVQPAAGDAGGALGCALAAHHIFHEKPRLSSGKDAIQGAYLGPSFSEKEILAIIRKYNLNALHYPDFANLADDVANELAGGKVVGWFQGRMEFGPRALGNRSILADPRDADMQKKLNLKIKFRESFRPFAPSVLEEETITYFDMDCPSPYMTMTAPVQKKRRKNTTEKEEIHDRLHQVRSDIPAVTHLDYSARLQTVSKTTNPRFWTLIKKFEQKTGIALLVNTSFNVRGEPIVCTPEDAVQCFFKTEIDVLVMGNFLFLKTNQPQLHFQQKGESTFATD